MKLICTDRGQHARRVLDTVVRSPETGELVSLFEIKPGSGAAAALPFDLLTVGGSRIPGWDYTSWSSKCPSCPRHVRVLVERLGEIVDGSRRVGMEEFDVSFLE